MELDDFKQAWLAHGAALERNTAISERLLREAMLGKTRRALAPFAIARALELVLGIVISLAIVNVVVAHATELRYLLVGAPLAAFSIAITASCGLLLVRIARLDYGGAVTTMQHDVEQLKLVEYHATKWAVLGGSVLWLPALLVVFEAVTGVAALARVDLAFLMANIAVGIGILVVGHWLSRRYVERPGARASRLVDALSGRSLRVAKAHLVDLARFQRE